MTEAGDLPEPRTSEPPAEPVAASATPTPPRDPAATVEKISAVVSPYFISLVGLYLYRTNPLVGLAIAALGLARLLKITPDDIRRAWRAARRALGLTVD